MKQIKNQSDIAKINETKAAVTQIVEKINQTNIKSIQLLIKPSNDIIYLFESIIALFAGTREIPFNAIQNKKDMSWQHVRMIFQDFVIIKKVILKTNELCDQKKFSYLNYKRALEIFNLISGENLEILKQDVFCLLYYFLKVTFILIEQLNQNFLQQQIIFEETSKQLEIDSPTKISLSPQQDYQSNLRIDESKRYNIKKQTNNKQTNYNKYIQLQTKNSIVQQVHDKKYLQNKTRRLNNMKTPEKHKTIQNKSQQNLNRSRISQSSSQSKMNSARAKTPHNTKNSTALKDKSREVSSDKHSKNTSVDNLGEKQKQNSQNRKHHRHISDIQFRMERKMNEQISLLDLSIRRIERQKSQIEWREKIEAKRLIALEKQQELEKQKSFERIQREKEKAFIKKQKKLSLDLKRQISNERIDFFRHYKQISSQGFRETLTISRAPSRASSSRSQQNLYRIAQFEEQNLQKKSLHNDSKSYKKSLRIIEDLKK